MHAYRASGRRWFLHIGQFCFSWEGPTRWRSGPFVSFRWGDAYTDGFGWSAAFFWHVHVGLEIPFRWRNWLYRHVGWPSWHRDISLNWYKSRRSSWLALHLGYDSGGMARNFRWQKLTLFSTRWWFGRAVHESKALLDAFPVMVDVGQWDGDCYKGTGKVVQRTTSWPRWHLRDSWVGVEVEMEHTGGGHPLIHPGKGENSWDIDDDGYYGWGWDLFKETMPEACERMASEVRALRRRRGGENWRPSFLQGVPT